ncbi:hypothetical protein [Methylomicrobium lacus]|uniref:hypothetical protein n=1 Tax=Methylomicrobium lacus TaxID=136992 RepID=UPI00045EB0C0|nr:hypothetical protein [Methylomicrobium lacus]
MQLKLIGPLRIHPNNSDSIFHSPDALKIGVYVYAVKVKNVGYLTTYVGETGVSFLKRIKDHVINTLGGYERIYDPDALQEGKKILLWNGMWKASRQDCFGEFIDRHSELAPIISQYVRQFEIFLLPLDANARGRRRIESAIAAHLYNQPLPVGEFIDSDIRYLKKLKNGETPFEVKITGANAIYGFPANVFA